MPTYDYLCETCGLGFELQQAFSEDTLEKCPTKKSGRGPEGCAKSGRGKVLKVFSAPGITFKGAGFYKNDSRGSSASKESPGSASSTSSSDSSSSSYVEVRIVEVRIVEVRIVYVEVEVRIVYVEVEVRIVYV